MTDPRPIDQSKRLSKAEADALADEFLQSLQHVSVAGQACGPEQVAAFARIGLDVMGDSPPILAETAPQLMQSILQPIASVAGTGIRAKTDFKKFRKKLSTSGATAAGLRRLLSRDVRGMSPDQVTIVREAIRRLSAVAANPLQLRNDIIVALKKNVRGKPGPKTSIGSQSRTDIAQAANRLRPVCSKILDFSENESKQPMPAVIEAVRHLHPEWHVQCDFLSSNLELVEQCLNLAKIRRAKMRGKASRLADALAGKFIGHDVAPSYSMQLVELARRENRNKARP